MKHLKTFISLFQAEISEEFYKEPRLKHLKTFISLFQAERFKVDTLYFFLPFVITDFLGINLT